MRGLASITIYQQQEIDSLRRSLVNQEQALMGQLEGDRCARRSVGQGDRHAEGVAWACGSEEVEGSGAEEAAVSQEQF